MVNWIFSVLFIICHLTVTVYSFFCDYEEISYCSEHDVDFLRHCTETATSLFTGHCGKDNWPVTDNVKQYSGEVFLGLNLEKKTHDDAIVELGTKIDLPRAYERVILTLSEFETAKKQTTCKEVRYLNNNFNKISRKCFWNKNNNVWNKTYVFEVQTIKGNLYLLPRKLVFKFPDPEYFNDDVLLSKRSIFAYIDFSNFYTVSLKIQSLPAFYNVTYYKIESFRERDDHVHKLDVRLIAAEDKPFLEFEHFTYGEEGYHYFALSVISPQCPEDYCSKSFTAKLYISRKNPSMVIGIAGATLLIPLILYIFYIWSCKFQYSDEAPEVTEKILFLFNSSYDLHNQVIATLAKIIKSLTGIHVILDPLSTAENKSDTSLKRCSDNLILASHIIYIVPPVEQGVVSPELDCMTQNFIKKELQDPYADRKIIVIQFSYTNCSVPQLLTDCCTFHLMHDFAAFIHTFRPLADESKFEHASKELNDIIEKAHQEIQKRLLNVQGDVAQLC